MSEKKRSIGNNIIFRLAVLGVFLFVGTGLAAGIGMYQQNLKIYREAAASYVNILTYEVDRVNISEIIQHEQELHEIGSKLKAYYEDYETNEEDYRKLKEETGKELSDLYGEWGEIDTFIVGFGNLCTDIRYAYVAIPKEDEMVYIWDSDLEGLTMTTPFNHFPYIGKEKEHFMAAMRGEVMEDFFTDYSDGELFGTALSPIWDENDQICAVVAVDISVSSIRQALLKLLVNIALAILMIMLVSMTVYHYVAQKKIVNPIVKLTRAADNLVNNLQREDSEPFTVDVHTGDEIDVLARSFESMDLKLLDYIRENAAITAEKERIGTELDLAKRIQADMLPQIFPPFPERHEIDLYASMVPARDVGGDFYDFFMLDENRLALVIADVSGKGIPAALFMMMSKNMVQNFAQTLDSPAAVLRRVNNRICRNTQTQMFVTIWLGVLDLKTGLLTAANAGHEYPVFMEPGGDYRIVKDKHGLVAGGVEGYPYTEYQMQLAPGTRLFLYTDGLPEATDTGEKMFGTERMLKALNEVKDGTPKDVLDHVTECVTAFVGDAPQFDDTTMLCLDYYGKETPPAPAGVEV